jgi:tetratricopeptide (TPR) repeat protein
MKLNKKIINRWAVTMLTLTCFTISASAQLKNGNKMYSQMKYNRAIPYFLKTIEGNKENEKEEAVWKLAECYRLTNCQKEASVWYEEAITNFDVPDEIYLNYGNVLRTLENYEKAKANFEIYINNNPDNIQGVKYKQFCDGIQEWLQLEASAKIENDSTLNSRFSDFSPVIYKQGLVFISDRDVDLVDNNNYMWTGNGYLNLFYIETERNAEKQEASLPVKMSKSFNQNYHDGPVCFSKDEMQIFTTRTLKTKLKRKDTIQTHYAGIYWAKLDSDKVLYQAFKYNNPEFSVAHPAVSEDGKQIIFSSNKPGGFGKSDLYFSKLEEGKWTEPINLGEMINTFGNEYFPYWVNKTTLYFSSDGRMGYGGLDIYVSKYINGQWQKAQNLKAPINSSYDDFGILFTDDKTKGYFSSNRPGGKGADDIYKFWDLKIIADPKNE